MQITSQEASDFHCPRWNELPGIPLYMDQVVFVLQESLSLFAEDDGNVITATMINNYVKQKVIVPPGGKRYGREQLATLIMVCLLKRVFSISEIIALIELFTENGTLSDAYDLFCSEFEISIMRTFVQNEFERAKSESREDETALAGHAAIAALTGKLFAQNIIYDRKARARAMKEQLSKEKKTDGKK